VRKLQLSYELARGAATARHGTPVTDSDYEPDLLIGDDDVDVYKPDGSWLLSNRVAVYDPDQYKDLVKLVATMRGGVDGRRGNAVHRDAKLPLLCKDGTVSGSRIHHVPKLRSLGDAASFRFGYSGRDPLNPYARKTGDWEHYPEVFGEMLELFRTLDSKYREIAPEAHSRQSEAARNSPWTIQDTCFSSVTVNRNWQSALHTDDGNFGPAVATVLTKGEPKGADLAFLQYFLPVRLRPGNVLVADTRDEFHGNTALYGVLGKTYRISFFAYLHDSTLRCGSFEEEAGRRERWKKKRDRNA
jgi:hypothetical protein